MTFNYDTLLDQTLEGQIADWTLATARDFDAYTSRSDWRLYKLHGSTNWCRVIDTASGGPATRVPAAIIAEAAKLDVNAGQLYPAPWSDPTPMHGPHRTPARNVAVPAISVPVEGKMTFECPSSHVAGYRADCANVTHLLIVGWRAAEPHALEALKQINPHCHLAIVGPDAKGVYAQLDAATINAGRGAIHTIANRAVTKAWWPSFEQLLQDPGLEDWLNRPVPWPHRYDHGLAPWQADQRTVS